MLDTAPVPDLEADIHRECVQEDLEEMFEKLQGGVTSAKELFCFDDGSLNAIESLAVASFRQSDFHRASVIYGFLLLLDPERRSSWQGLAACARASGQEALATTCLEHATEVDAG